MQKQYSVAIIGCGIKGVGGPDWKFIYKNSHADAVNANPRLTLSAVCDIDSGRAQVEGERLGVRYFTDWREMLERAKPDLMTSAAGPEVNVVLVREELQKNKVKGLFVEKPLSLSLRDLD